MRSLIMKYVTWVVLVVVLGILMVGGSCEREQGNDLVVVDDNPYFSVMFYNVENLFDTLAVAGAPDEEFTPGSEKEWNSRKLFDKLDKIARVAAEVDSSGYPEIIGLCEVENRDVLEMLVNTTSLKGQGYQIVHKESPDYRGIDVALLYKESTFALEDYRLWPVWFPFDEGYSTREVLYVKGNLDQQGSVHFFVNHWPSRSGGEIETRPKRIFVAEMVRTKVDSILQTDPQARIILMGDLNDEPDDLSVVSGLNALGEYADPQGDELYSMTRYLQKNDFGGSYKYQGNWNHLDQFVVSGTLLDTTQALYCRLTDVRTGDLEYLFEEDKTYMGVKPFRTYLGDFYHGGYSDHLPVILRIRYPQ